MTRLGNKLHFGLDYSITNFKKPVMGYAKVWFGGSFMCTQEDLVYIDSYIFGGLKQIADAHRLDIAFEDKYALFAHFYNGLDNDNSNVYHHLVSFGTAADDFIILAYLDNTDTIHLVWRLEENVDTLF